MKKPRILTYSELCSYKTFEERFNYCMLGGKVGDETFGSDRYLNQRLYTSQEWKNFRRQIIIRDNGFDLGCQDCPISGRIYVHHLNPLTIEDLENGDPSILFNPQYFISVSFETHQALHYGFQAPFETSPIERTKWDTCPWRRQS